MAFASKVGSLIRQSITKHTSTNSYTPLLSSYNAVRNMSSSKLFVGGLSWGTDDQSLREAFLDFGEVTEARVIMDRETGRSRGFGFVSFTSGEEASAALSAMDGKDLNGRAIRVNYATERTGGFGGGGGYGGGGYGGGGGSYGGGGYGGGGGGYGGGDSGGYGGSGGSSGGYGDGDGGGRSGGSYAVDGGSDDFGGGDRPRDNFRDEDNFAGSSGKSY